MSTRALAFLLFVIGCSDGSAALLANHDRALKEPLTGTWEVTLTLQRPYPLGFSSPTARRVCGTIGFVDVADAADRTIGDESDGVYQVPLAQLGLDWMQEAKFPLAVAHQAARGGSASASPDSVAITLNPSSRERIELLGVQHGSEIDGNWTAQSARGTASGLFTLRRRLSPGHSASC
jgi:hypothetical protein